MIVHRITLCLLADLFLAITNMALGQPTKPWLSLKVNSIDIRCISQTDVQQIPVILDGVEPGRVKLLSDRPQHIRLGNSFASEYANAVKAEGALVGNRLYLKLTINVKELAASGTYDATFIFVAEGKDSQEISISMVRPAAKIESVSKVQIEIVDGSVNKKDPIALRETGHVASLFDARISAPFFYAARHTKLINLDLNSVDLIAGNLTTIDYIPDKTISDLDNGKYSGKMEVFNAGMTSPAVIEFEVFKKSGKWLIVVMIFSGVLAGVIVRKILKDRKTTDEKKFLGWSTLLAIAEELRQMPDPEFNAEIEEIVKKLKDALARPSSPPFGITPVALENIATQVATEYKTSRETFIRRTEEITKKIEGVYGLFDDNDWTTPSKTFLSRIRPEFVKANAARGARHFNEAEREIHKMEERIKNAEWNWYYTLADALLKYFEPEGGYIFLDLDEKGLPKSKEAKTIANLTSQIKSATRVTRKKMDDLKSVPTISTIRENTGKMNDVYRDLEWMVESITQVAEKLMSNESRGGKNFGDLQASFETWRRDLIDSMSSAEIEPGLEAKLKNEAESLSSAWVTYRASSKETVLGNKTTEPAGTDVEIHARQEAESTKFGSTKLDRPKLNIKDITDELKQIEISWWKTTLIQGFFVLALMALAAMPVYGPSFIGTPTECISILLFAFGLDISIDGLITLSNKKV